MKIGNVLKLSRLALVVMCMFMFGLCAYASSTAEAEAEAVATASTSPAAKVVHDAVPTALETSTSAKYLAIAIIMGCGSLAAALAVGKIGAATMGAAAEKPELLGKAIAFVGLGEGIALFGFLISLFLLNQ